MKRLGEAGRWKTSTGWKESDEVGGRNPWITVQWNGDHTTRGIRWKKMN